MDWLQAVILGLLQGVAEFLPISSSGHLVLGQYMLGLETTSDVTFEVFVHFGTVLSIVTVYRARLVSLSKHTFQAIRNPGTLISSYQENSEIRFVWFIFITLIPTGIVYLLFRDSLESAFADPRLTCMMLLVTGLLLLLTRLRPNPNGQLTANKSVWIGFAQGAALIPGISRSGSTICTALFQNVDRGDAADFSFIMSLPAILGATAVKALQMFESGTTMDLLPVFLGTAVAYLTGIWAIRVVLNFVRKGRLVWFAVYCFAVGTIGLLYI